MSHGKATERGGISTHNAPKGVIILNRVCTDIGVATREKILNAVIEYFQIHGYSPSVREIGEMTGIKSTSTINHHLFIMFEKGILETDCGSGSPRAIRVLGYKFVKIGADENE